MAVLGYLAVNRFNNRNHWPLGGGNSRFGIDDGRGDRYFNRDRRDCGHPFDCVWVYVGGKKFVLMQVDLCDKNGILNDRLGKRFDILGIMIDHDGSKLYLVSTPIGNLGDMSFRAVEVLKEVDYVVSEDTRKTGMLLKHFEIKKPQISFREDNEKRALPRVLNLLQAGNSIAVVTDAGTPSVSDPGFLLVREALAAEIPMTAVPGPTALIMALVLSGLAVHSFTFRGFPPRKSGQRKRFFEVDLESPHTLIFYESPHRLQAFLQDALAVYGDRPAAVANDLTKKFETIYRGTLGELVSRFEEEKILGEYCVVIAGFSDD